MRCTKEKLGYACSGECEEGKYHSRPARNKRRWIFAVALFYGLLWALLIWYFAHGELIIGDMGHGYGRAYDTLGNCFVTDASGTLPCDEFTMSAEVSGWIDIATTTDTLFIETNYAKIYINGKER